MLWLLIAVAVPLHGALRQESFDHTPPNWEGVNHRSTHFPERTVTQDFGFNPDTRHAGARAGEVGGRFQPAGEAAWYGWRLPQPRTLEEPLQAQGTLWVAPGGGHFLLGFFNTNSLNEWRTPNSLALRLNGRGDTFHCHFEYTTRLWRAGAGVIGTLVPGERITAQDLPSGRPYAWTLRYDPSGGDSLGEISLSLRALPASDRSDGSDGSVGSVGWVETARCTLDPGHRKDGATFTHFGLLPVLKTWDGAGEAWIDDVKVEGVAFDFSADPKWEAHGNRETHLTTDTRPRFDFGWSPTHHARGRAAGELGGLVFRGDCREPARMACYGDRLEDLTLEQPLMARGKVVMLRGVTDSTASIGFYHQAHSMTPNPSQKNSVPRDYLGINIEGPSSEGFFFYPVYRTHDGDQRAWNRNAGEPLRIRPDGTVHEWWLTYDPADAEGRGRLTVGLDDRTCVLDLEPGDRVAGTTFNRFGLCTPWIDGNSVTLYFDDLTYTASP